MRGLIATPGVNVTGSGTVEMGAAAYDMHQLRSWLLFWDKVVDPMPHLIFSNHPPEYTYLENVGFFARQPVQSEGGEVRAIILDARVRRFVELEKNSPGAWALASTPGSWEVEQTGAQRALRVHLMSALPVPDQDVALEDIMSFREHRKAEREALMSYIDDIYQSVLNAEDKPLAEHTAMKRLAAGARDQLDAWQETKFTFRLFIM